jgi:membrane fusion protein (multidrug efflux system)
MANRQYVMVRVNKDGKDTVEKRDVEIGIRLPGYVEILAGLSSDEYVVTHGNSRLHPGDSLDVLAVDNGSVDIATIIKGQSNKGK